MTVTLVAAIARNGVMGDHGVIPWRLPAEQQAVKTVTMGHTLLMGRRTYASIGRPLPGRTTVVLTHDADWAPPGGLPPGVHVATEVAQALAVGAELPGDTVVFGGAEVYRAVLPYVDTMRITWVDSAPCGDTHFPELDWSQWAETSREQHDGWEVVCYQRRLGRTE